MVSASVVFGLAFARGLRLSLMRSSSSAIFSIVIACSALVAFIAASRLAAATSLSLRNAFPPYNETTSVERFNRKSAGAHQNGQCHTSNDVLQRFGDQMSGRLVGEWKATIEMIEGRRYLLFTK